MGKKRILVVDDEAGFTRLLKMNLEKSGSYDVMIENRSTKAMLAAKMFRPHAIVLDIVMPEMDGGDVQTQLAGDSETENIPVIMLTALVDENEVSPGAVAQAGATNVLAKPVNLVLLLECLDSLTKNALENGNS
jgi:DNA-binding response OmpR family regulator